MVNTIENGSSLAIAPSTGLKINNIQDLTQLSQVLAKSGFFQDAKEASQAAVKVLAGLEMGFGSIASMTGIHIIKGKPSVSANLMAAAVKRNPKYDYRVITLNNEFCEIAFFEGKEDIGRSTFTIAEAKKAGTQNIDRFPKNMLFARAMSNGVRFYCPDVFDGHAVYTPEELGAQVDGEGNILDVVAKPIDESWRPAWAGRIEHLQRKIIELGGELPEGDQPDLSVVNKSDMEALGKRLKKMADEIEKALIADSLTQEEGF